MMNYDKKYFFLLISFWGCSLFGADGGFESGSDTEGFTFLEGGSQSSSGVSSRESSPVSILKKPGINTITKVSPSQKKPGVQFFKAQGQGPAGLGDAVLVQKQSAPVETTQEKSAITAVLVNDQLNLSSQLVPSSTKNDVEEVDYNDLGDVQAEYDSLVALNYSRLSTLDPREVTRPDEACISKMISYLGIFKGALTQLAAGESDAAELAKINAYKKTIVQQRNNFITLQERVAALKKSA